MNEKAPWIGVKRHYSGDFPKHLVGLHFFQDGYCGISRIEDNKINCCYLVHLETFKKYKDILSFENDFLKYQPQIAEALNSCHSVFEKPVAISQINFSKKNLVENHILFIGDASGMIHPLSGNGMSIAIQSAQLVCKSLLAFPYVEQRTAMETYYKKQWQKHFRTRMRISRLVSRIMQYNIGAFLFFHTMKILPFALRIIIKKVQGTAIP